MDCGETGMAGANAVHGGPLVLKRDLVWEGGGCLWEMGVSADGDERRLLVLDDHGSLRRSEGGSLTGLWTARDGLLRGRHLGSRRHGEQLKNGGGINETEGRGWLVLVAHEVDGSRPEDSGSGGILAE